MHPLVVSLVVLATLAAPASAADCGIPPGTERCEAWSATYGDPAGADAGAAVVASPDGSTLFVTGRGAGTSLDIATIAYDAATGVQRWTARYDSGGDDAAVDAALAADGSTLFVLGSSANDYVTVAYDAATGEERWHARYDGPAGLGDTPERILVGGSGQRVYVTGWSSGGLKPSGTEYDYATVAYDASSGAEVWVARFDGPASFWDIAKGLAVGTGPDGRERVVVTGRSNVASTANDHTDYVTVGYDGASGARLWTAIHDGPSGSREYPYAAVMSPDGRRVFVTGESTVPGRGLDYATVAYDASTGDEVWVGRYGAGFDDRALDIAVAPDGNRVVVTGFVPNNGLNVDRDAATVAYDATTGEELWDARRTGPAGEAASRVELSADGARAYVAGVSGGLVFGVGVNAAGLAVGYAGFLVAAYDTATGDEAWVAHHGGAGGGVGSDAFLRDLAVAPTGRVFVTGVAAGDYRTVAYEA